MFTVPFNELSVFDKAGTISFYLTVALVVFGVVFALVVKKFKQEQFSSFKKAAFIFAIGYAVGLASILMFLKLNEYFDKDYIDLSTFIPVVVMIGSAIVLALSAFIVSVFKKERLALTAKISFFILTAQLFIILIIQTVKYYKRNPAPSVSGEIQLYVYTALLIACVALIGLLVGKKQSDVNKTRSISYAAMCAALAFALSYIRFFELPQGGSVTLASLLPLMLYSYMFGVRRGIILGGIYGLLQFIQAPWFYHPVQFLLDYPLAFGAIGLSGLLRERNVLENKKSVQFAIGAIVAAVIRYLAHVVSGIFVFGSGDPENYSAVGWSFLYNSFAFADMAVNLVVGCILFASKSFVKTLQKNAS